MSQCSPFLHSSRQGGKQNQSKSTYGCVNLSWPFPGEQMLSIYIHVQRIRIFLLFRESICIPNRKKIVIFEDNKSLPTATLSSIFSRKEKKKNTCWNLMWCISPESFNLFPTITLFLPFFLSFRVVGFYPCISQIRISGCSICSLNRASELFLPDLH